MAAFLAHGQGQGSRAGKKFAVGLLFNPPDRRHRDWDNLVASMKAGLDGIADGLKTDDRGFRLTSIDVGEVVANGQVVVTLKEIE